MSPTTLRDVTEMAAEAGFIIPVKMTESAWDDAVAWNDEDTARTGMPNDEPGRLWDVVWMALWAVNRREAYFTLHRVPRRPAEGWQQLDPAEPIILSVRSGYDDDGSAVMVIDGPEDA